MASQTLSHLLITSFTNKGLYAVVFQLFQIPIKDNEQYRISASACSGCGCSVADRENYSHLTAGAGCDMEFDFSLHHDERQPMSSMIPAGDKRRIRAYLLGRRLPYQLDSLSSNRRSYQARQPQIRGRVHSLHGQQNDERWFPCAWFGHGCILCGQSVEREVKSNKSRSHSSGIITDFIKCLGTSDRPCIEASRYCHGVARHAVIGFEVHCCYSMSTVAHCIVLFADSSKASESSLPHNTTRGDKVTHSQPL